MRSDIVLPAFEMDCRDWLVVTPSEAGLPDEVAGSPLLAVLSTAVVSTERFCSASAVLTVGLLDEDSPVAVQPQAGCVAAEMIDADEPDESSVRYLCPSPDGSLALLAEFTVSEQDTEVTRRIEALMTSFRWAA